MKKKTIYKRKISKECWALDASFLDWLRERLPVYLREAGQIVNLEFHKFKIDGEERTQKSVIEEMIKLLKEIEDKDIWDDDYHDKANRILDLWKEVFHAMWW